MEFSGKQDILEKKTPVKSENSGEMLVPYNMLQNQLPEVFYKKTALTNFAIFTGKYLCWSLFLMKDAYLSQTPIS